MEQTKTKSDWEKKDCGALWKRKSAKGESFLSGKMNFKNISGFPDKDVEIIVFSNKSKEKINQPDLRCYLSDPKKPRESGEPVKQATPMAASEPDNSII